MAITSIKRDFVGDPNIVRIETTDDLTTITTANYLLTQKAIIEALNNGEFQWVEGDMVLINYSDGEGFFIRDAVNDTFISENDPSTLATLSGNTGTANPVDGNINIKVGTTNGTSTFTGASDTVTLTFSDAQFNTSLGSQVLGANTTSGATNNTAMGVEAGKSVTTGDGNCYFGYLSGTNATTGGGNCGYGIGTLKNIEFGAFNIALGFEAGSAYGSLESSNIVIGNTGVLGESNTIRIGSNTQTSCYIQGIQGVSVSGTAVFCAGNGQLGTVVSSERYKENIVDLPDLSDDLMKLRPVAFNYKSDDKKRTVYGLIAEEVEKDFPYLCFYKDGEPESVKYQDLPVLLLAEVKKLRAELEELKLQIQK